MHRGHVMLRDDSATNLSPRMFREFAAPYDGRLLKTCGSGAIHSCGKVGHFLGQATALPGIAGFNFGQPELNDPQVIQRDTIDRQVPIVGLDSRRWSELEAAGVQPKGMVHVC
jgi:uroporphyrinogen-III decarboxylase